VHYDVFNGDADGICSIVQLRLAHPRDSAFVTGTKRDIALLDRVHAHAGDTVTVLDVSAHTNRAALERLAQAGAAVEYFDHHFAGDEPMPAGVVSHIDTSAGICTGMLVDRHLHGRQRIWAVVAAFGDNLIDAAFDLAAPLAINAGGLDGLKDLADALTHNSYSDRVEDALIPPATLARLLIAAADPLRFIATSPPTRRPTRRAGATSRSRSDAEPAYVRPGAGVRAAGRAVGAPRARDLRQRDRKRSSARLRMRSSPCARTATTP
jgi:hypothetical protein